MKFNIPVIAIAVIVNLSIYGLTEYFRKKELYFHYPLKDDPQSSARKEIEERELRDKLFLRKCLAISAVIVVWQGIWEPTHLFQIEKVEANKQYEAYISGYENGWNDQCWAVFSRVAGINNPAFGRGIVLTYPQCVSLKPASGAADSFKKRIGGYIRDSSAYEMRESGRNNADADALEIVFSMSPYWCYGVECVSESDFGIFRSN